MKTIKTLTLPTLISIVLLVGAGCTKQNQYSNYGSMHVKMTDAPGHYAAVNVEIKAVEVHYTDTSNSGWITLNTNAGVYDLLKLRNDITATIASSTTMGPGKVTQMRLILGENNSVVLDSATNPSYPLVVPSGQNTGLKINIDQYIMVDSDLEVVLDFDAEKLINITGNGTYMLSPFIKVKSITTN